MIAQGNALGGQRKKTRALKGRPIVSGLLSEGGTRRHSYYPTNGVAPRVIKASGLRHICPRPTAFPMTAQGNALGGQRKKTRALKGRPVVPGLLSEGGTKEDTASTLPTALPSGNQGQWPASHLPKANGLSHDSPGQRPGWTEKENQSPERATYRFRLLSEGGTKEDTASTLPTALPSGNQGQWSRHICPRPTAFPMTAQGNALGGQRKNTRALKGRPIVSGCARTTKKRRRRGRGRGRGATRNGAAVAYCMISRTKTFSCPSLCLRTSVIS
jgi:hypothetical protein